MYFIEGRKGLPRETTGPNWSIFFSGGGGGGGNVSSLSTRSLWRKQRFILECNYIGLDKQKNERKSVFFSYPSVLANVLGAQKNRLFETVLLSTHNICFG